MRSKESLEVRRSRGEISCAECRRHKLKCNKTIPCSTCVRKGCSKLCPNGTLAPVQGTRPSATDVKRQNTSELTKRVRQLEDALQIAHGAISKSPHPLLTTDTLVRQNSSDTPTQIEQGSDSLGEHLVNSVGKLEVSEKGMESYIGGVEEMWAKNLGSPECIHPVLQLFPKPISEEPIMHLSNTFPFAPLYLPAREIQAHIEEKLPSPERASALVEAYLENLSWFIRPIDREQIVEELIPEVYRKRRFASTSDNAGSSSNAEPPTDPHVLALLLAVFSCGADGDLTLATWNDEADLYYHLARAAVSLKPVFDGCSLHTVQAIMLIAARDVFSCRRNSLEGTWKMMSFVMSLAVSIGLHRDPSHFNLSPKIVQRRRRVFWELYSIDTWKSIGSGRPMMFSPSVVDCEFPEDREATFENGQVIPSLWRTRHLYVKEVLIEVVSKLSETKALKYSEIVLLDQKIRNFNDQFFLHNTSIARSNVESKPKLLNRFLLVLFRDTVLLMLHRNLFARAMDENPTNPVQNNFAPSFLITYRSAVAIVRATREQLDSGSHFLMRLWPVWAHALCSTVIIGAIASSGSTDGLAPQAYAELNAAIEMLSTVQLHPLVKGGLPVLLKLRTQAYQALLKTGARVSPPSSSDALPRPPEGDREEEFNPIIGMGRMVRKGLSGEFSNPPQSFSEVLGKMLPGTAPFTAKGTTKPTFSRSDDQSANDAVLALSANHTSPINGLDSKGRGEGSGYSQPFHRTTENVVLSTFGTPPPPNTPLELFQMFAQGRGSLSNSRPSSDMESPKLGYDERNSHSDTPSMQVDGIPFTKDVPPVGLHHEGAQEDSISNLTLPTSQFAYSDHTSDPDSDKRASCSGTGANIGPGDTQMQPHMDMQSPFIYDNMPAIFPTNTLDSDFDVSFDVRASIGDESGLPSSPSDSDMQVWRTILQDSRFFGGNYMMDTEQGPLYPHA